MRLGLSGVVAEGDTDAVLDRAIGHVRDTPLPWQEGQRVGRHRDRFRRSRRRSGDIVRLKTPHGDFDYEVHDTLIVKPEDVWVLDPTGTTMLT